MMKVPFQIKAYDKYCENGLLKAYLQIYMGKYKLPFCLRQWGLDVNHIVSAYMHFVRVYLTPTYANHMSINPNSRKKSFF